MTTDFFIPKLEQTEEVTIVNWLVEDGAEINEGDEIVEIETDKAVVPVPANASGYLRIGAYKAGDIVSTLTVIATIGGQDEAFAPGSDGTGSQTVPAAEPVAATAAQLDPPSAAAEAESEAPATGPKPRATPVAQKMATDLGVDLQTVTGSGDHGKITKVDVRQAALPEKAPEPTPAPQPKAPSAVAIPDPSAPAEDVLERVPLKSIRGVISRRMAESVHTTARVTLVTEVDATELVILREQLKARFTEPWGFAPGYNDLLAIMVANALRQFPYMNARLSTAGDAIEYVKPINIGMAVDTDRGLMVPVIRDVDKLGLQDFGSTFRELVNRARSGKSKLEDLSGGTFTITSLGIYRVEAFTPVINLPQAAILGLGRIKEKPVVKDGEIVARKILTLSLVFDHRLTDGAPAARFLDYICELIEEPYLLFLTKR
jgi:pyruvate dehydrogenase E2 component (dihydrolipoamide acetyltransferase)